MCTDEAKLKAVYTLTELAGLSGISRRRVLRLLGTNHVRVNRSGRSLIVLAGDLKKGFPGLWDSVVECSVLRRAVVENHSGLEDLDE